MTREPPSKERLKEDLLECLDMALSKLTRIWTDIGIHDDQRKERADTVLLHLRNLLEEMVKEEEVLKTNLVQNVEAYGDELVKLSKEMSTPLYKPEESMSILQMEKELRTRVDKMSREKHQRLKSLKLLRDQDQSLCDILCATPYYIPTGSVPSVEQLDSLEKHIAGLQSEKEKRFTAFVDRKKQIGELLGAMEKDPESSFEREVMCENEESFLLSSENMKALDTLHSELEIEQSQLKNTAESLTERIITLWERLSVPQHERDEFLKKHTDYKHKTILSLRTELARCEALKLENIQRFVEAMRTELVSCWENCFYSKAQRDEFRPFTEEIYTEILLEVHEHEVQRVKTFYEKHRFLFDLVHKRNELFHQMVVMEKKANDPSRYNNRGGALLKEQRTRNKVLKELPRVEEELRACIKQWETESGSTFLIEGVEFPNYCHAQWEAFQHEKVREKEDRHQRQAKIVEDEMHFGSKPSTPAKRRFLTTPTKTPTSKVRKMMNILSNILNETQKTPRSMTCSRLALTSTFASPVGCPPRCPNKHQTPSKVSRRCSQRLQRKVLSDKNSSTPTSKSSVNESLFSGTTVSSGATSMIKVNSSLASTGSYMEFANGLNPSARPHCRSSVMAGHPPRL